MEPRTEVLIRMSCFAGVLLVMLAWELMAPRRRLSVKRTWRWSSNLGLVAPNNILVRLVVPLTAMGAAEWAHRSVIPSETNRKFGFNLPWWDYIFRTYQSQPAEGHRGMEIGLQELRDERQTERQTERLPAMLMLPFARWRRS